MTANEQLIVPDWPAPASIVAGCTTRSGGISEGPYSALNLGAHVGDDPAAVEENRRRMVTAFELPNEPRWLEQIHGSDVVVEPEPGSTADAALSREKDVVCTVMIADCLPVLLCSDDGREVAASHAGWRGLAAGVLENTVATFAADPGQLCAWLGPAISQDAFEVGDEVRAAFVESNPGAAKSFNKNDRGRWQADLFGLARQRLEGAGVRYISGGGLCTYSDSERFFSYRRDGQCGRLSAFIYRSS